MQLRDVQVVLNWSWGFSEFMIEVLQSENILANKITYKITVLLIISSSSLR